MRLIKIEAFIQREKLFRERKRVDRGVKVLEFGDDENTKYAILSHRWMKEEEEVDYGEMVKLAKMAVEERDRIRQRAIKRSFRAASRLGPTDMSGCGSTLAVSTSEAVQKIGRARVGKEC